MTIDFEKSATNKLLSFIIFLLGDKDKEKLRDLAVETFNDHARKWKLLKIPPNYTNSAVHMFFQDIDYYYAEREEYTSIINSLIVQYSFYVYFLQKEDGK